MQTGRVVASGASANPQRRFGEDVISRIAHAGKDAGNVEVLRKLVVDAVSDLAGQCVNQVSALPQDIDEVSIVGNTTMEQLFYGAHPYSLGTAPFLPLTRNPVRLRARDVGLSLSPGTPVYVFPVVSGFVGGDTLGAVLADKPYLREDMSLIVDIGTNGELVMGNRHRLWAASCATGPAFEGAHLSCGMRAVPGAISKLDMDADTGGVSYELIGEDSALRPMGLCGSGIIDAIAALRRTGIILESGSFRKDSPGVVYDEKGIGREFDSGSEGRDRYRYAHSRHAGRYPTDTACQSGPGRRDFIPDASCGKGCRPHYPDRCVRCQVRLAKRDRYRHASRGSSRR